MEMEIGKRIPPCVTWPFVTLVRAATGSFTVIAFGWPALLDDRGALLEHFLGRSILDEPPDEWSHEVRLSPFFLSKYELFQSIWVRTMGPNPSVHLVPHPAAPVNYLSWGDGLAFSKKMGHALPTEAQWEYACRGDTSTPFGGTERLDGFAHIVDFGSCNATGLLKPNPFGFHDMHGNFTEWCQDFYDPYFYWRKEAAGPDPVCTVESERCLARGNEFTARPWDCRSAFRKAGNPEPRWERATVRPARAVTGTPRHGAAR
jgi:formylglycine-generating enzyme required for sulfatase activity